MISRLLAAITLVVALYAEARPYNPLRETDSTFFATPEAIRIGRQVLAYQRHTGGWPKNIDISREHTDDELAAARAGYSRSDDSTTDNEATTMQMAYLARLYKATGDTVWSNAVARGAAYLLSGQYPNGGWPQFWPEMPGYRRHITYNDNAMVNTMTLIRDMRDGTAPYDAPGLITDSLRQRLGEAFDRGIECILSTQIIYRGEPTVWCQQHDRETLAPVGARAFELPAFCSTESMAIVWLLMDLPEPDERVCRAIEGAMRWFDRNKIEGLRVERTGSKADGTLNTRLVPDSTSTIWARYYDLADCRPFVCDRDGIPRERLEDIGPERRSGYSWYSPWPAALFPRYEQWKKTISPDL